MSAIPCSSCGLLHVPSNNRQQTCLPCWKSNQGYELTKSDEAHVRLAQYASQHNGQAQAPDNSAKLRDTEAALRAEQTKARNLEARIGALMAELNLARATTAPSSGSIPQDTLIKIISLCHPDRHNNSEASTEATKFLLSLRKKR